MLPEPVEIDLHQRVLECLDAIVDPCSVAAGAPAGLVSMGLVGDLVIDVRPDGTHVAVKLFVTEPTCMMGAIFEATAMRELANLPGVSGVTVTIDRTKLWSEEDMAASYRRRLRVFRNAQAAHREVVRS